jgi:endonuclease YncB( thermonuclease family)
MNPARRAFLVSVGAVMALAGTGSSAAAGSPRDGAIERVIEGRVVGIIDGDSLRVLDGDRVLHEIRLAGIDTPERNQPFSERARQNLARLAMSKPVRVEVQKRDRYDRLIAKVWVTPPDLPCESEPCPKTLDVGRAQLTTGLAWFYRQYAHEQSPQDRASYDFDETEARVRKVGLWSDPAPVPPWEWRRNARERR